MAHPLQVDALLLNNAHLATHIHHPEKAHNVLITHADAAETGWLTETKTLAATVPERTAWPGESRMGGQDCWTTLRAGQRCGR